MPNNVIAEPKAAHKEGLHKGEEIAREMQSLTKLERESYLLNLVQGLTDGPSPCGLDDVWVAVDTVSSWT